MENLKGPFTDIIPNFQKYKKSLGYKYNNIADFYKIDKILMLNNCYTLENTELIYNILIIQEENENNKKRNYKCLKELYHFLEKDGYKNLYLKPYYSKVKSSFKPIILTSSQINLFFQKLDEYCDNSIEEKSFIFSVLFRLVYSCGLRITEALNLKTIHFSKENRTIFIEQSKENVDRLLPLSNSMYITLEKYEKIINFNMQEYLFEVNNKKISYYKVKKTFDKILKLLNFDFRIHDLRHTFAITVFNRLFDKEYNEYWILYYLNIYLGHKNFQSTEHYLHLTPKRYKMMIKKMDKTYESMHKEVCK